MTPKWHGPGRRRPELRAGQRPARSGGRPGNHALRQGVPWRRRPDSNRDPGAFAGGTRRLWNGPMSQKPQVRGHVGPLTSTFVEYVFCNWPMSTTATTANERWRGQSQRFPYRLIFSLVPIHTMVELRFEARLAWLRLTRRGIDSRFESASDLLVNVGCGPRGLDGWVNIDCVPAPGVTCVRDCRTALPLPSGSARGIFTEHFLEHLDYYEEAPKFLQECRRLLRPGGLSGSSCLMEPSISTRTARGTWRPCGPSVPS